MSKCRNFFISCGEFKKALLFPFLLALTQTIIVFIDRIYPEKIKNHIFESTSIGLGQLSVIIIPHIKFFSLSNNNKKAKCECSKKNCCHYTILLFLYAIEANLSYSINLEQINNNNSLFWIKTKNISTQQGIEIIIITLISLFLLKYKYFIHHYLSIFLFCLSSVGFDLIIKKNRNQLYGFRPFAYLILFVGIFAEGVYFCYIKYMIDKHYHYYWNIMFFVGLMVIIVNIIIIIVCSIFFRNTTLDFIYFFWKYFDKVPVKIIVSKFIINYIFQFISSVMEILTIFYLTPEYILIAQNLSKIYIIIYILIYPNEYINKGYEYCYLLIYAIQIFSLMIYLEIIELNFCKLNKNTRKNIKSRVNDDLIERIDSFNDNEFEAKGGYIFNNSDDDSYNKGDIKIELNHIEDTQEKPKDNLS